MTLGTVELIIKSKQNTLDSGTNSKLYCYYGLGGIKNTNSSQIKWEEFTVSRMGETNQSVRMQK